MNRSFCIVGIAVLLQTSLLMSQKPAAPDTKRNEVVEVLRSWGGDIYYPGATYLKEDGREQRLDAIRQQLPGLIDRVRTALLSGQFHEDDAPAYLTLLRIRYRLTGQEFPRLEEALVKASKTVLTRGKAGSGIMLDLAVSMHEVAKLDIDVDSTTKMAARLGSPSALDRIMWGTTYTASGVELDDNAEYYFYGILKMTVQTALNGYATGVDDYGEAAEAARQYAEGTKGLNRMTEMEKEAARLLRKMDWDKLREESVFLMDCENRFEQKSK